MKELLIGFTIIFLIYGVVCAFAYREYLESNARDRDMIDG